MEFSSQSWKSKAVYVKLVIEVVKARKIMTKKSNLILTVIETWRRSWNLVMKFEELKGVRTLPPTPKIKYCRLVT